MKDSIFLRTSVRQYTDGPVSRDDLVQIVRAGMAAPSARNAQPWQFLIVEDEAMKERLAGVSDYTKMCASAAAVIIVLGDRSKSELGYIVQDCSAATENMLLEAWEMGIGTVWLGVYPREERQARLQALFDFPEHIEPLWMVALGWPAHKPEPKDKFDASKIFWGAYGRN